jgi:hypothetical protein
MRKFGDESLQHRHVVRQRRAAALKPHGNPEQHQQQYRDAERPVKRDQRIVCLRDCRNHTDADEQHDEDC